MYSEPNQIRAPTTIIPSLSLKEQKTPKSQVLGGPRRPYQHSQKLETFFVNNNYVVTIRAFYFPANGTFLSLWASLVPTVQIPMSSSSTWAPEKIFTRPEKNSKN